MVSRLLRCALAAIALASPLAAQRPVILAVGDRSNDNPSIAAAGDVVAVAWSAAAKTTTDIYAAVSRDGGSTFAAPVRVNATTGDARVSGEQPPRVILVTRDGRPPDVVIVWTAPGANGSRLLFARSVDGGRSFTDSKVVPGGEAAGNRGWESVAVDSTGRVYVLWLDHREAMSPGKMHHQEGDAASPAPTTDPVEKAARSQLYLTGLDATAARSIARGVCYCCKTSLVAAGSTLFAAWRHVFPGGERDIAFTMSRDAGRTFTAPARVSADHWRFDGCPENGPALAVDGARRAHVVWVTPLGGAEDAPLVLYHAVSTDGVNFSPRTQITAAGPAAHPQAAVAPDGTLLVAWDELVGGIRRLAFARGVLDAGGRVTFRVVRSPFPGDAAHPVVAAAAHGSVAAWVQRDETGNRIGVARIK